MAVKKSGGLGRGLDALFSDTNVTKEVSIAPDSDLLETDEWSLDSVNYFDINNLKPNLSQPRKQFDEEKIADLAESIKQHGVIQPIIVRPSDKGFEIVAGERRWRASRVAGLKSVPCLVRELTERENMLLALIENMQREDLNPIEEALAFREMMTRYGLNQEDVSKSVAKSRPYISNALRLLKLPEEIRELVVENRLSGGHAREIAGVEDTKRQLELANLSCDGKMSVRELEKLIAAAPQKNKSRRADRVKDPELVNIETELKSILGTKVNVSSNGKKGKIEISFFSPDDFDRIMSAFKQIASL